MSSSSFKRGSLPRRSLLSFALGAVLASGAVHAQSTVGSLYGTADAGATIQAQNVENGQVRQAAVGSDGRFNLGSLTPGNYRLTLTENGQTTTRDVRVIAGQGLNLSLGSASANAKNLEAISVTGNSLPAIDVSSVESTTVLTSQQIHQLPIARNQTSVALLAPGAVAADSSFGNLAVFNGASAAENSYYVNGFNVTNQYQTLSFSEVPFESIDQEEVKTGGYGAQYGNSTGGVISVITKRGTNEWKGGGLVQWTPNALRSKTPEYYYNNGKLRDDSSRDTNNSTEYSVWMGGPLIRDRLFIFGLFQQTKQTTDTYGASVSPGSFTAASAVRNEYKDPFWLVKLDWNITDNHILEYTGFSDSQTHERGIYYQGANEDNESIKGQYQGTETLKAGGNVNILKYTGYLTDDLTLSAQYGKLKNKRYDIARTANGTTEYYDGNVKNLVQPGCPYVIDGTPEANGGGENPYNSCWIVGSLNARDGEDERRNGRIDLEWRLGNHDLKAGWNRDDWSTETGSAYEGGMLWYYWQRPDATTGEPGGVEQDVFSTGAKVTIVQKSYYLEDTWQVTDRFMAYIGARNDSFYNKNGKGETYVSQSNIWQPRLGFSWDVNGDSSLKIYGTAGKYSLPIAANVALRGAAASVYHIENFAYTQVDPVTGAPLDPESFGDGFYVNGETGNEPPAGAVADQTLKPYQQREFILGADKQVGNWVFGVKAMYRSLSNAIDDFCDWRAFQNWGARTGHEVADGVPETMPGCWLFNPGRGATYDIDVDGNGSLEHVVLSKADIGQPKAKRTYKSIELSAEHQFEDNWYMRASYVWSKSQGNTEGLVKSDNGQTDTGTTQDFDYPELMIGSYGYLPNDRRHQVKVYGAWRFTPEWTFGANLLWSTGRPENCFGRNPIDDTIGYRNNYFYCNGKVVNRGSVGTTPNFWNLDLSAIYTPTWASGLRLQADVVNIFNRHNATSVYEYGENSGGVPIPTQYLETNGYQTPRYFRFTAQYDFSL